MSSSKPVESESHSSLDAFLPPEMAKRAEQAGVKKANLPPLTIFLLAVLAGAFIAMGSVFSNTVTAGSAGQIPFGVTKLLGGLAFSLGLILVVVAGAELFTGNNLKVMALASGKISWSQMFRGWAIVYLGNAVGSVATAALVFLSGHHLFGNGAIGFGAVSAAAAKCQHSFVQALVLGILCNALVCLAVWLCFSARSITDKVLAIVFPITAFVAAGFEHCVANMYIIPYGLMIKLFGGDGPWDTIPQEKLDGLSSFNAAVGNLLPVTIGNILGGTVLVGMVYWVVFLRNKK